jgi:photosystem II stability/assembly factor-like uncharacterized protein
MTSVSHAARVVMLARVTAQAVIVLVLHVVPVLAHRVPQWVPTPRQLMAATSRQKLPLVATPRKPPLSASVKPRQLQQLTVPRLSNQSEQRRI